MSGWVEPPDSGIMDSWHEQVGKYVPAQQQPFPLNTISEMVSSLHIILQG